MAFSSCESAFVLDSEGSELDCVVDDLFGRLDGDGGDEEEESEEVKVG